MSGPSLHPRSPSKGTHRSKTTAEEPPCYIHRLPPELLIHVFIHYEHLPQAAEDPKWPSGRAPRCAAILQVCSRWRATAEGCSDLWTTVPAGSRHWTKIALQRSSNRPIDLCTTALPMANIRNGTEHSHQATSVARHIIENAMFRIRAMALDLVRDLIQDLERAPAPELEALELRAEPAYLSSLLYALQIVGTQAKVDNAVTLPDTLFCSHVPNLRELHLKNVDLAGSTPLLSSRLTVLSLWGVRFTPGGSIASLLRMLRGLTNLEELRLTRAVSFGVDSAENLRELPPVEFLRLRTVVFEDHAKLLSGLVKRIIYPKSCSLTVRFIRVEPIEVSTIYMILTTTILSNVDKNASYSSLRISQRTSDLQPCFFSTDVLRFIAEDPSSAALPLRPEIALTFSGEYPMNVGLIAPICDAFPGAIRRAPRLDVDHRFFGDAPVWRFLRGFSRVREVRAGGRMVRGLKEALRSEKGLFPMLERVRIAEAGDGEGELCTVGEFRSRS